MTNTGDYTGGFMDKEKSLKIIGEALEAVRANSNNYGMAAWKWDVVKSKINDAENALEYLKNAES